MDLIYYQSQDQKLTQRELEKKLQHWNIIGFNRLDDLLEHLSKPMIFSQSLVLLVISDLAEFRRLHASRCFSPDMFTVLVDLGTDPEVYARSHLLSPRVSLFGSQDTDTLVSLLTGDC